jgi:hypothetical protein
MVTKYLRKVNLKEERLFCLMISVHGNLALLFLGCGEANYHGRKYMVESCSPHGGKRRQKVIYLFICLSIYLSGEALGCRYSPQGHAFRDPSSSTRFYLLSSHHLPVACQILNSSSG